ncbi:amidohydrolase [Filibacter tadaridae]|uniref:N-substituted formamide deformylase n=1 Tax=Filibacter tadaridae TaxID=2483811 RepID=A0A3P5X306_9BACL|nr:amidohydrolase [Filibacter tadaridae]VDC22399.1 N-substituted formamide deformylase precursor [Filibacter tadaridae]
MKKIWHNGTLYTMEKEHATVEAILTEDGTIVATGNYEQLKEQADKEMDLKGAVLYPGFVDSHMHMIGHGEKLLSLDLSKASSADEMMDMLRGAHTGLDVHDWFIGEGWNENNFPDKKILSRFELDNVTDSPMVLKRTCRHAALANSKALALAGITKETPDPVDGVIVRDEAGEPTGFLLEGAQEIVLGMIPEPTEEALTRALRTSVGDLLSLGLTGAVTDDLGYYGDYRNPLQAFKNIIGQEKKFRAHLLRRSPVFPQLMEDQATYDEPWIEPGAMKFFIDGALGGKTALLSEPYADAPETRGMAVHTDEEIDSLVALARKYGEAIAVHIIGDGAIEKALDAIEKYPAPPGKLDRLIHVNVLREDLVERMKKLPVILDIQPVFVSSDFPWVMDRLGEARFDWAYAWNSLLDRGFICGGGSDAPIEEVNPLLGIYAAATRRKPGETHEGYLPSEKLSRFEAVGLFTTGSAATISKADVRGKLAAGYDADFTVLDRDLFQVEDEEMLAATVVMTVIAGEVQYSG